MIAIDTNILVRLVTRDDETQFKSARNLISEFTGSKNSVFINHVVLCELFWVLKTGYKYNKEQTTQVFEYIMGIEEFHLQEAESVMKAIYKYKAGNADFADYLIHSINEDAGCIATYSFDKGPVKENLFTEPPK